jgi:TolB-like protein
MSDFVFRGEQLHSDRRLAGISDPSSLYVPPFPLKSIQAQLEKILASQAFLTTESLSRFLRYIVEQTVHGQGRWLKESVLGVEVFGRGKSFDPRLDPIVRVDARRLRTKLAEYYQEEGQNDAVVIEVKKGSYAPVFRQNESSRTGPSEMAPSPAAVPIAGVSSPNLSSIVVLPFVNLSSDVDNDYFSDGLTQEVIATLARIPGLRVIARSTAFRYQGKAQDIGKIGAELNVGAVLEGSVRKTGNRLRIAAQLIDVSTCFHIWSETFEREVKDIFAIQQEISDAIGSMVRVQIPGASLPVVRDYSDNVEAYDLYLRGIHFERKRTADALAQSLDYLQQAATKDPHCAPIFARLANSYIFQAVFGLEDPTVVMERAKAAAAKALEIDETLAEAHAARAMVSGLYDWDWTAAEEGFRRALELNRGVAEIHYHYANFFLTPMGRLDQALQEIRQGRTLDPLSLLLSAAECALLSWAGQCDAAIGCGEKTLAMEPHYFLTYIYISWACLRKGKLSKALETTEAAVRLSPNTPLALGTLGIVYAVMGRRDEAAQIIDQLKQRPYAPSGIILSIYGALKDPEGFFEWLEKARCDRSPRLAFANVDLYARSLRSDPRFDAVLGEVGLQRIDHFQSHI